MQAGGSNENMNLRARENLPGNGGRRPGMAAVKEARGLVAANPEGLRVCRCRSTADRSGECTAKTKCRKFEQIFPEKEYREISPNFHIHMSVGDGSAFSAGGNMWTDPGNI